MNTTHARTLSILQRIPAILAVTAASYGLALPQAPLRGPGTRLQGSSQQRQHSADPAALQRAGLPR